MGIYDVIGSGMTANKLWMDLTANNIANMNTTRTAEGGPYHRQTLAFRAKDDFTSVLEQKAGIRGSGDGVIVDKVIEDKSEDLIYSPEHPDANEEGYVRTPAINMTAEMTNMMMAQRAYESNVTVLNATKEVNQKTNEIGRI